MTDPQHHLAQLNIARMKAALEDPVMTGFVEQLDAINAVADNSDGFVWRLQTEEENATALRVFDDPLLLINISVWESVEALHAYVYKSAHMNVLKEKKFWFNKMKQSHLVLWWVPKGHIPGVEEARAKLALINDIGPSPGAFTFSKRFPPPGLESGTEQVGSPGEYPGTA